MRWDPYVLSQGDGFDKFWRDHLADRKRRVLLVVGRGFDSRALDAPSRIIAAGGEGDRRIWLLAYHLSQSESTTRAEMTSKNVANFNSLLGTDAVTVLPVNIGVSGNRSFTSRNAKAAVTRMEELTSFTDVIVDVSAMPRMVALTVIAQLIALLDDLAESGGEQINLHVVVAESVAADHSGVSGSLSETVTNVVGFSGHLDAQATINLPRVWFPILGEGQSVRLERIWQKVNPDEVCPVIPFPSRESRRGDLIIDEYRQVLFEEYQIEPRNILHACEYNPFEAYREIFRAIDRYRDALKDLGGCKVFVSPLSSKLLSIGALLACYDHRKQANGEDKVFVGMPYLESVSYADPVEGASTEKELYSMWLRGEWET